MWLLAEPYANWHVETTTETRQLRVTKKGRVLLQWQQLGPLEPGPVWLFHSQVPA